MPSLGDGTMPPRKEFHITIGGMPNSVKLANKFNDQPAAYGISGQGGSQSGAQP